MKTHFDNFLKIIQEKNIQELSFFEDRTFWNLLSESDKIELAKLFLLRAEQQLKEYHEIPFSYSLTLAEELAPESSILCQIALLLFHFGILSKKRNFLLQALDKLIFCEEQDPHFIESKTEWLRLWGNVLAAIAVEIQDESFFEKALQKYAAAERIMAPGHPIASDLYWDEASSWILLSKFSGELSDLKKGIERFAKACSLHPSLPHLRIEYAESLIELSKMTGNPEPLEEAISLLCGAIADTYLPDQEPSLAYKKAWVSYAEATKVRFELTHAASHLEAANTIFLEAALNAAYPDLWLSWGELFLHAGLVSNCQNDIETAIEKLTSSKVNECDPLKVSALLGQGIMMLGYWLDDLKLLRGGKQRIERALEAAANHASLSYTQAISDLYLGLYFSDSDYLIKAIFSFEINLKRNVTSFENLYGLYQAYNGLGSFKEDPDFIKKSIDAINRLCVLRPYCATYLNEKGLALLKLKEFEPNYFEHQAIIEEAIVSFRKALILNEDEGILFNLGCAIHLLGECVGNEEDYLEAIDIFSNIYEKKSSSAEIRYHLASALSHLGELTSHIESLMQAVDLFESLEDKENENDLFFCDYGYTLLNLAELTYDSNHPEKTAELRCDAEKKLIKAVELGNGNACYHLACLYSLCEFNEASLQYLRRAVQLGCLPTIEDLENDEWLESVRKTAAFREFLTIHKRLS